MKTKIIAALIALSALLICGCVRGTAPLPVQYVLFLELVDSEGRNISKIAGDSAKIEVFDSQDLSKLSSGIGSSISREDNVLRLSLIANGGFDENRSGLTWKISCKEVFGDDNLHILQSNWMQAEDLPNWCKVCVSFTFEGKTYYPKSVYGKNGVAKVVID